MSNQGRVCLDRDFENHWRSTDQIAGDFSITAQFRHLQANRQCSRLYEIYLSFSWSRLCCWIQGDTIVKSEHIRRAHEVQVLQRIYKYGGQPFARDFLAKHYGDNFDRTFGKGTGKAIMHATAGRYVICPVQTLQYQF